MCIFLSESFNNLDENKDNMPTVLFRFSKAISNSPVITNK